MRYGRARAGGSAPEDPRGQRADTEVDDCHERHHRADEHEHRRRVPDQLLAGRPDDLLELGDDLPDEAGDAREETEALGLLAAAWTRRGTPGAVGAAGARPCGFAHSWSLRMSVCPARRDVLHPSGRTGAKRPAERGTRTYVGTNCERIRTGGRQRRRPHPASRVASEPVSYTHLTLP